MSGAASRVQADDGTGRLAAAVRVVSGFTLLSRFAGLARDVLTARLLGDGLMGSSFRAAYALPNFFRRLFGEGALSAAFLPEYALARRDNPEQADALAARVVRFVLLVTSSLSGVIVLALLARMMVSPPSTQGMHSILLVIVMLPMMPAVCIAAVLGGILQAHGRFAITAASPIVLNLLQIGAGLWFVFRPAGESERHVIAYTVAVAALLASWAVVAWAWWGLRGKVRWARVAEGARESVARVRKRFIPAALGLGTLQLNSMADMLIAMWPIWIGPTMLGFAMPLDQSSNAVLSYTQTLYQFPLGVFGIAVATAVFPLLSRSSDQPQEFLTHLRRGLRLSFFIALPATVGLMLVREDLVFAIFGGGSRSFSEDGLARSADVLLGFAPAIWAYSLNHVLTRAYYAKGDTTTPMKVAGSCVLLNIALNLTLIWFLREAGMAWATATSATVQCALLLALAPRTLGVRPLGAEVLGACGKIALAAGLMGVCVALALHVAPSGDAWSTRALRLLGAVGLGGVAYAGLALALGLPELRWLFQRAPAGKGGGPEMPLE